MNEKSTDPLVRAVLNNNIEELAAQLKQNNANTVKQANYSIEYFFFLIPEFQGALHPHLNHLYHCPNCLLCI